MWGDGGGGAERRKSNSEARGSDRVDCNWEKGITWRED